MIYNITNPNAVYISIHKFNDLWPVYSIDVTAQPGLHQLPTLMLKSVVYPPLYQRHAVWE